MLRLRSVYCYALVVAAMATPTVNAETAYISDELTVPLRSGPSNQHRILHQGLPSGTQLEILNVDETAGFSQIRTLRGTEGWLRSQYLVSQPIAKMRLAAAQRELTQARQQLTKAREQVRELTQSSNSQASANEQGQARIEQLEKELEEIKRISAAAIQAHSDNQTLKESNARLRDELDDLAEERNRLEAGAENQSILYGAGLILIGLLAGVIIKARPQRSAWS